MTDFVTLVNSAQRNEPVRSNPSECASATSQAGGFKQKQRTHASSLTLRPRRSARFGCIRASSGRPSAFVPPSRSNSRRCAATSVRPGGRRRSETEVLEDRDALDMSAALKSVRRPRSGCAYAGIPAVHVYSASRSDKGSSGWNSGVGHCATLSDQPAAARSSAT